MSKLDKDTVLENFTQAYIKANGKAPTIEAKGGWYSVDGGKNMRLAQLEEETTQLASAKAPAKEKKTAKTEKPVAKKEVKAETKEAPKAKAKPKAAKAAAPKKAKKAAKTFSVKDFYTKQIMETNPGARAPR